MGAYPSSDNPDPTSPEEYTQGYTQSGSPSRWLTVVEDLPEAQDHFFRDISPFVAVTQEASFHDPASLILSQRLMQRCFVK